MDKILIRFQYYINFSLSTQGKYICIYIFYLVPKTNIDTLLHIGVYISAKIILLLLYKFYY